MLEINGFITNLGKYNEGVLVGEWVQFPITEEEETELLERIGINKEYEKYFFTDYESDIDLYDEFGEYATIENLNDLAEQLDSLDDDELEKLDAIMEVESQSILDILDNLDDYEYYGGMTLEDYAFEVVNDCYNLSEFALQYFDYEAFARDLSYDGYTETSNGVIRCY